MPFHFNALGELYFESKRNREARAKTLQKVEELQNHLQRQRQELLTSEQENDQLEQEKNQLEQEKNQLKQRNLWQQYCIVILLAALAFVLVYFLS